MSRTLERHLQREAATALDDTRVVLINGARQAGKSTLVRRLLRDQKNALYRTLDDGDVAAAARADPPRFVRHEGTLAIDEIQRLPELLLAIKSAVDKDDRPGQFLLTGSARILGLKGLPDTLVGRMETIELWPFSQGELERRREGFVDRLFDDEPRFPSKLGITRDELLARITRGGFPEAVRREERRRAKFFEGYAHDLVERDISQLADLPDRSAMHALLKSAAALPGQLLKVERLASDLGVSARTVERYLTLLEELFLIKRLPAWSNRAATRAVKMSKVMFVDTGLCAHLQDRTMRRLLRDDAAVGPLCENFVLSELARQLGWSETRAKLSHFRTRDQVEVDGVLEAADGRVVGIEIKAAESVRSEDFAGLRHLETLAGKRFHHGIVLFNGNDTLPFGERLTAVPIDALWRS